MMFSGIFTALITPFKNEKLDEEGLFHLVERQRNAGVSGVVLLGTTGETPTLTCSEKASAISIAKDSIGKVPLIVGTGAYSTEITIENTKIAEKQGADAIIVVTPFYNKPTQEGLYEHYRHVALSTSLPVIVYNIPGRTAVNLELDTLKRLIEIENIVGIKEQNILDIIPEIKPLRKDFSLLAGDDPMTLAAMAMGADGIVSVMSNLYPEKMVALVRACQNGDFKQARELFFPLLPLMKAAFIETNPIPIKAMMAKRNLPSGSPRLPLTPLSEKHHSTIEALLKAYEN